MRVLARHLAPLAFALAALPFACTGAAPAPSGPTTETREAPAPDDAAEPKTSSSAAAPDAGAAADATTENEGGGDAGKSSTAERVDLASKLEHDAPREPLRALALYEETCAAGDLRGCLGAARMHQGKRGVKHDYARAAEYYEKVCDHLAEAASFDSAGGNACTNLAEFYALGQGVKRDDVRATELYTKAWEEGRDYMAIAILAQRVGAGLGVPKNKQRAAELAAIACGNGFPSLCKPGR